MNSPWSLMLIANLLACGISSFGADGTQVVELTDPAYGSVLRQLRKDDGHEHNLYYYREPWNADGSRLLAIQSDLNQQNWRVCLYDGDGVFLKQLYSLDQYDWRLCWDRQDPNLFYTYKGQNLYRFNIATGQASVLKSFAPEQVHWTGPSINQAGDRILIITTDANNQRTFRTYHLPDLSEGRSFTIIAPTGCSIDWDKPHYTGYSNYIDTAYSSSDGSQTQQGIVVHNDTGVMVHTFSGIGGGGHFDWSPDAKLAYFVMSSSARSPGGARPLEIHVVNVDGTNDRVLWSVPSSQASAIQNLHLSWPKKVNDWFIASLFPYQDFLPDPRTSALNGAPRDEIVMIKLDATVQYLAHSTTWYDANMFWAEPLGVVRGDGKRICFHTRRSGTIDLCILFPLLPALRILPIAQGDGTTLGFSWTSTAGQAYQIEMSYDLVSWRSFGPSLVATGPVTHFNSRDSSGSQSQNSPPNRFYRVRLAY